MKWWHKLKAFLTDVRSELGKATFPSWLEVRGTTLVVIVTGFIFAVFLWIVDLIVQQGVRGIMGFFTT